MDLLMDRDCVLDRVQELDELLMGVALHAAPDDIAFEHVQGGEQGRGAVPFAIVGHGAAAPLLQRQAGLSTMSAWIWLFSSTDSTTACCGGLT